MISREDVKNLAKLARIGISEEEEVKLVHDLGAVLGYVSELDKLSLGEPKSPVGEHRNVMRDDGTPHESGLYTEKVLAAAAETKGGRIAVRQIIEK